MALPELRQELQLFEAPPSRDGSPNWSLRDPVRNIFFRIDWLSFEILLRWRLGESVKDVGGNHNLTSVSNLMSLRGVRATCRLVRVCVPTLAGACEV